jgi:hypothetical protein
MTNKCGSPRKGSGYTATGRSTQSDALPGAWFVLEPSNPQIGRSARSSWSSRIFVFERKRAVGSVPSIQMYSALMVTVAPVLGASAQSRRA